jgi:hypothetical protein
MQRRRTPFGAGNALSLAGVSTREGKTNGYTRFLPYSYVLMSNDFHLAFEQLDIQIGALKLQR